MTVSSLHTFYNSLPRENGHRTQPYFKHPPSNACSRCGMLVCSVVTGRYDLIPFRLFSALNLAKKLPPSSPAGRWDGVGKEGLSPIFGIFWANSQEWLTTLASKRPGKKSFGSNSCCVQTRKQSFSEFLRLRNYQITRKYCIFRKDLLAKLGRILVIKR